MKSLLCVAFLSLSVIAQAQMNPLKWFEKVSVSNPGARSASAMAFDTTHGVMVLFGGNVHAGGNTLVPFADNTTWSYDGSLWRPLTVTGTLPTPRSAHTMSYDPALGRVVMFGGTDAGNQLWSFEFTGATTGTWHRHADLPSAGRRNHLMAYDGTRGRLVVVGGVKDGTAGVVIAGKTVYPATREVWEWDHLAWTQGPDAPEFTQGPHSDQFALGGPFDGALEWHASSGQLVMVANHSYPHSDPGYIPPAVTSIIYAPRFACTGSTWTQMPHYGSPDFPDAIFDILGNYRGVTSAMAYDSARDRLVYSAGGVPSGTMDIQDWTSEFSGQGWTFRHWGYPSPRPPGWVWPPYYPRGMGNFGGLPRRSHCVMAYDSVRRVTVRFGGYASGATVASDTWELDVNPAATPFAITADLATTPLQLCSGGVLTLTGAATGETILSNLITFRWYRDGALVSEGPSTTHSTLTRNPLSLADQGVYHFAAVDLAGQVLLSQITPVFVHEPAVITQQPVMRRVVPGEKFALTATATSTLPMLYQWYRDNSAIPGATASSYLVNAATLNDAGLYRLNISTGCHLTQSVEVRVEVGPRIVSNSPAPQNANVFDVLPAITVNADGVGAQTGVYTLGADPAEYPDRVAPNPLSFVWRHEGVPLAPGAKYTITNSALATALVINNPDYEDEGYYDCVVTDISGPAYAKITQRQLFLLRPLAPPYVTIQQGRGPDPRINAGMVYDSLRGRTVLFGGECYGVNPRSGNANPQLYQSNDTFEWDGQVWVKRNPATRPPAMTNFGMVYDSDRGRTVLFGGHKYTPPDFINGTQVITNDLWEWDGLNWTQITPPSSPLARTLPVMCFDTVRRETLMIGGSSFNPEPPDYYGARKILWAWNGTQWMQRGSLPNGNNAPYMNAGNTFAFDEQRGVAAMFGTFGDNENPVWEWNGAAWSRVLPPIDYRITNSGTGNATPFYDPLRHMTCMSIIGNNFSPGYESGTSFLACWNGSRFLRGSTSVIDDVTGIAPAFGDQVPDPSRGDMTVFDTRRRCLVWLDNTGFFLSSGTPPSTREMHFSAKVKPVHQPYEVIFAANQTITLRAIHAGSRPLVQQWFKDGSPVLDDAHWSGAATATLRITGTTAADAGLYTLRASNIHNLTDTPPIRLSLQNDGIGLIVQGIGLVLSWPGATGILESAPAPNGPWTAIYGVTPPYSVAMDEARKFYRVRYP